jgi:hypothetical protein
MIEASIEAGIVTALKSLLPTAPVFGFWDASETGEQKLSQASIILVKANPKGNQLETVPTYSTQVEIVVLSAACDDPDGKLALAWGGAVCDLADGWNGRPGSPERAALITALTGTGYTITGMEDGAGDCGFDYNSSAWYVTKPLTVHFIAT